VRPRRPACQNRDVVVLDLVPRPRQWIRVVLDVEAFAGWQDVPGRRRTGGEELTVRPEREGVRRRVGDGGALSRQAAESLMMTSAPRAATEDPATRREAGESMLDSCAAHLTD